MQINQVNPWTDSLIRFLNELVTIDPAAIRALLEHRVPCNEALANHSTVQVGNSGGATVVGLLGVLNGFCGVIPSGKCSGWGPIAAVLDDGGKLIEFCRTDQVTDRYEPTSFE